MSKRPVWSWKDVTLASKAAATRRVVITLDVETYDRLQSIAIDAGTSCADCAASILHDVAAEDAAPPWGDELRMARRPSHDPAQVSFFDLPQPPASLAGFGLRLREALVETLALAKEAKGLDRFAVAAEMSRLDPEREVSKAMLDRYCAPSSAEWRFPLEALPALIRVTDDARLLTAVAEACDHRVVPSEAAALGELMMLELKEKRIRERKEALKRSLPQGALQWAEREAARRTK